MSITLPTYSSKGVKVSFGGAPLEGFGGDTFLTITPNSDLTMSKVGPDGLVCTSVSPDTTAIAEVVLDQQSIIANKMLADIVDKSKARGTVAYGDLVISDPSGGMVYELVGCHIQGRPTVTLGKEASERTWTFHVSDLKTRSQANGVSVSVELDAFVAGLSDTVLNIGFDAFFGGFSLNI